MRLITKIKLSPTAETHAALLETLKLCNQTANTVSKLAYEQKIWNKTLLQKRAYQEVKETGLAAQASIHVIRKVANAYTTQKALIKNGVLKGKGREKATSKPVQFREGSGQAFDDRNLSYQLDAKTVSIWTVQGRKKDVSFEGSLHQLELLNSRKGETDLLLENGTFYLVVGVEIPEEPMRDVTDYLGFDSGIVNIATTSDGDNWSGGAVTLRRKKNRALRAKLQRKGTKSAKKLLKKRSKKETRFVKDTNHVISKKIVELAKRTGRGIAHENLKGIRERVRLRKPQRTELNSWAFNQLFEMVAYKAKLAGIPVKTVDPAYSSQLCPKCGSIGKQNRPIRDLFYCSSCGLSGPADLIAARNIRTFALAT
jgi:IS605 OrfB family transposase